MPRRGNLLLASAGPPLTAGRPNQTRSRCELLRQRFEAALGEAGLTLLRPS